MIPPDGRIIFRLPSAMGRMEQGVVKLDCATAYHFSPSYGDFYSTMQVKETSILDCLDFHVDLCTNNGNQVARYEEGGEGVILTHIVLWSEPVRTFSRRGIGKEEVRVSVLLQEVHELAGFGVTDFQMPTRRG